MDAMTKLKTLGIKPITDSIYQEHLKQFQLVGVDVSEQRYFKMYGETPMFYSLEYIANHSLEDLMEQDKENKKRF